MGEEARSEHYFALPAKSKLYEFEIEAVLGHGGFGITYRANDTLLQETVAIKEFLPNEVAVRISDATIRAKSQRDQPDFEEGLKSFLEEARMMARFRHPRIVHVRRFFELHGTGYIVLDYEHGKTLGDRLSEGPQLSEAELRDILSGVLDGLEAVHGRAILHRDLKPNNIMLREDGAPVIIDFGAARDFQTRHSRSVTAIATAGYAPPEQYGVGGQQGPWSDLYALGAIAYRAVSGLTPVDSLRRLRSDPLVPAVTIGIGKYDNALLRTIDWMLKIDEADRPVSVAQVREALRGGTIPVTGPQSQAGRPASNDGRVERSRPGVLQNPASGTLEDVRKPSRRRKISAVVAGLLVSVGLAVGAYAFNVNYQARQQVALQAKQEAERQAQLAKEQQAKERQAKEQQAREQQAREEQQRLAGQLAEAGSDQSRLEQFLAACGSNCPDMLRSEAQTRIEHAKGRKRQEELARLDEATYRSSHGNLPQLQAYVIGCTPCAFKEAARAEIAQLEDEAVYRMAIGNLERLRAYNANCTVCAFRQAANENIANIERRLQESQQSRVDESAGQIPGRGAEPVLIGRFGTWGAYKAAPDGKSVCFALAKPTQSKTDPPSILRDPAYAFVTIKPERGVAEVSIAAGAAIKVGSSPRLKVGGTSYALMAQGDGLWIKDRREEERLIETLRGAGNFAVEFVSQKGAEATEFFSLEGLAAALNRLASECRS